MSHKIITCTGYGNTGSSAGTNFFEEFSGIKSYDSAFECTFLHENDGIADLAYALETESHRLKVDLAVKRFLTFMKDLERNDNYKQTFNGNFFSYSREYIDLLCSCKWDGIWHRALECTPQSITQKTKYEFARYFFEKDYNNYTYNLYEADGWTPSYRPFTDMYYTNASDKFKGITKSYLSKLFNECDLENKYEYLLLDQILPVNNNELYSRYFDFIKTVVIDRDPRDLYYGNKASWGCRYIPSSDISIFIQWFKETRQHKFTETSPHIMFLNFEDFIYKYEETKEKLINFIEIDSEKHINQFKYFDPKKSIANTRYWQQSDLFKDDIKRIEDELGKYCFDYDSVTIPKIEIENKQSGFIFDTHMLSADKLQKAKKISFMQKLEFSLFDFYHLPLGRTLKNIKKNINKPRKQLIKEILKIGVYTITLPFDIVYKIIKTFVIL